MAKFDWGRAFLDVVTGGTYELYKATNAATADSQGNTVADKAKEFVTHDKANAAATKQATDATQRAMDAQQALLNEISNIGKDQTQNDSSGKSARIRNANITANGRAATILTSPLGIIGQPLTANKTLLGS